MFSSQRSKLFFKALRSVISLLAQLFSKNLSSPDKVMHVGSTFSALEMLRKKFIPSFLFLCFPFFKPNFLGILQFFIFKFLPVL